MKFAKSIPRFLWVILFCLVADAWFFYGEGLAREASVNLSYVQFIQDFPESLGSARQEPLFITLSYIGAHFLGNNLLALILLKFLAIGTQLFLFYRLAKIFTQRESLALGSILLLNFSFAYFSIADNLLRNHFANLFFLGGLLTVMRFFTDTKPSPRAIGSAIIGAGLLPYTHILPTFLFDSMLVIIIFILITVLAIKKSFIPYPVRTAQSFKKIRSVLPSLLLFSGIVFCLQLPYLARLAFTHANIGDYRMSEPTSVPAPSTALIPPSATFPTPWHDFMLLALKVIRILGEFRLPGFSLISILLVASSLILLRKKAFSFGGEFPLLILFFLTYFASKCDLLFGIGTLPYRFSLMLIFPALLLVIITIDTLLNRLHRPALEILLLSTILLCFIGSNIVPIAEVTLLRDYQEMQARNTYLKQVYADSFRNMHRPVFLVNGESFDEITDAPLFLRNPKIFSTFDENEIVSFMREYQVDFVIFDMYALHREGSDLGSITNTNLSVFEHSTFFEEAGEFIGPGTHILLFSFQPEATATHKHRRQILECEPSACPEQLLRILQEAHSPIRSWSTEITHLEQAHVREFLTLQNGHIIEISYDAGHAHETFFTRSSTLSLIPFPERKGATLTDQVDHGALLIASHGFHAQYMNLEESNSGKLQIFGKIDQEHLSYTVLTRNGYRVLVQGMLLSLFLLIYFITHALHPGFIFDSLALARDLFATPAGRLALFVLVFSIFDMFFLNFSFLPFYKHLFGI